MSSLSDRSVVPLVARVSATCSLEPAHSLARTWSSSFQIMPAFEVPRKALIWWFAISLQLVLHVILPQATTWLFGGASALAPTILVHVCIQSFTCMRALPLLAGPPTHDDLMSSFRAFARCTTIDRRAKSVLGTSMQLCLCLLPRVLTSMPLQQLCSPDYVAAALHLQPVCTCADALAVPQLQPCSMPLSRRHRERSRLLMPRSSL